MDELISVIVPIYNSERFLEKCISSILSQSYGCFELLLVDDGSTDGAAAICHKFMEKDSRVKYFYQKNAGVSTARNVGLKNAEGIYITFVDADDWIEKEYLERLRSTIKGKKLALCGYKVVVGKDICEVHEIKVNLIHSIEPFFNKEDENLKQEENVFISDNVKGFVWRCLFLKSVIKCGKICFNEKVCLSEDLLFLVQYINLAGLDEIGYVQEYLYNYVQNSDSACGAKYKKRLYENRRVVNEMLEREILAANGMDFPKKREIIQNLRYDAVYEILSNEKNVGTLKEFCFNCNNYFKEGMSECINCHSCSWLLGRKEYKKLAVFILFKLRLFSVIYILFNFKKAVDIFGKKKECKQ